MHTNKINTTGLARSMTTLTKIHQHIFVYEHKPTGGIVSSLPTEPHLGEVENN